MSNNHLKRIMKKDMKSITDQELNKQGIYIHFNEKDITEAYAMIIGPKDSCYENGILYFKINFPKTYPHTPPKVVYLSRGSTRIHPNLYVGKAYDNYHGKVCLSMLNTWSGPTWKSIMDISSVLLTIQSLLNDNPLIHEPGYGKTTLVHEKYKTCVTYETLRTLIIRNIFDIPPSYEIFSETIKQHYNNNKDTILNKYSNMKSNNCEKIVSVYNISLNLDYEILLDTLQKKEI